jgi:hypothetical protein
MITALALLFAAILLGVPLLLLLWSAALLVNLVAAVFEPLDTPER